MVSVLANTTKIYGKEIALGAVPAGQTPEKSWAGLIVGVQGVIAMVACRRW